MASCRHCGKGPHEIGGCWLERVNELGVDGIWECRPTCGAKLSREAGLLGAIGGEPLGAPLGNFNDVSALRVIAEGLWQLLDDIDTVSDMAKGDNIAFRRAVEEIQAKRHTLMRTDGFELFIPRSA